MLALPRGENVVISSYLHHLLDDVDVLLPLLQTSECLLDVGAATLDDESSILAQDMIEIAR